VSKQKGEDPIMMMHKSPALRILCLVAWVITSVVAIGVGATRMGWNFLGGWLMNMPMLYYVILVAGLVSLGGLFAHLTCKECV